MWRDLLLFIIGYSELYVRKTLFLPAYNTRSAIRIACAFLAGFTFWVLMLFLFQFVMEAQTFSIRFDSNSPLANYLALQWNIGVLIAFIYSLVFALPVYFLVNKNRRSVQPWIILGFVMLIWFVELYISRTIMPLPIYDLWSLDKRGYDFLISFEGLVISIGAGGILSLVGGTVCALILNMKILQPSRGNVSETC